MDLSVTKCPDCKEPLNGIECTNCGTNTRTADITECHFCGEDVVENKAYRVTVNEAGFSKVVEKCPGC